MKMCRKCTIAKPENEFYRDTTATDGLRGACKECIKAARRHYVAIHRERVKADNAIYRQSDGGKAVRKRLNRSRSQTPEFKAYQTQWSKTEKGKACRRRRVNRFAKTSKGNAANKRRHATRRGRLAGIESTLTADQWLQILADHDNACAYCGTAFDDITPATQDHVIPISKGGNHSIENVVPACKRCNSSKRDQDAPAWLSKPA